MSFYQELSRHYDDVFALGPGEMDFLKSRLAGLTRILDVGCGTGHRTEHLAGPGREIIGLDLDPDMIALARSHHAGPGLSYRTGDMTALDRLFEAAAFDGLICLGNTLPHLLEARDLAAFFASAGRLLRPGGVLALQILNYDRVRAGRLTELPLIETPRVTFRRYYDWAESGLRFRTVLEVKGGPVYENDIPLRPIFRDELTNLLAADFESPEYFGGYDGRPLAENSLVLLALSRRK